MIFNFSVMGAEDKKVVFDSVAWFMNVSTSVLIVFINKVLMDPKKGYNFTFGRITARCWLSKDCCMVHVVEPRVFVCSDQPLRIPLFVLRCKHMGGATTRLCSEGQTTLGR